MEAATSTPSLPLQALSSQLFGNALAISAERAAETLECSRTQIYRLLDQGHLETIRIGCGSKRKGRRISVLSLLSFISNGGAEQPDTLTPAERVSAEQRRHARDLL